jgi:hypothetical protein
LMSKQLLFFVQIPFKKFVSKSASELQDISSGKARIG